MTVAAIIEEFVEEFRGKIRTHRVSMPSIEDEHVILNVAARFGSNGRLQFFARCNPYTIGSDGRMIVEPESFIAFRSGNKVIPRLISPELISGTTGFEDPACDGEFLVCNRVIVADNPVSGIRGLMPIPTQFQVGDDGPATFLRELTGPLLKRYCKGVTLLGSELCLARPVYENGKFAPKILLCRTGKQDNLLCLDPVAIFKEPTEEFPGLNISAPLVRIPEGWLLAYHRLEDTVEFGEEIKRYEHFADLLDEKFNVIAEGTSPFLVADNIPSRINSRTWVKGPVIYLRNLWYNRGDLWSIVTKGDSQNCFIHLPLSYVLSTMKPVSRKMIA